MTHRICFAPALLLLLAGCSSKVAAKAASNDQSPPSWNVPVTAPSESAAAAARASCTYQAGALPLETQGASEPDGSKIPIDTIVIIMMENRSFDHYFQDLPSVGITEADVAPAGSGNPGIDGTFIPFHHDTALCLADMNHEWIGAHQEANGGAMDGFAITNDGTHEVPTIGPPGFLSGERALTFYTHDDLPFMYWAAQNYAIGDRYFSALQGPTWPNRMYLYGASSFGITTNEFAPQNQTTLMTELDTRGVSWSIYADATPGYGVFADLLINSASNVFAVSEIDADIAAGKLPSVVFLDPGLGREAYNGNDEHPPAVMQIGQKWLAGVVSKLTSGPQWAHMAIFINYDENGGIYDHVPPVHACPPDGNLPRMADGGAGVDAADLNAFDETGMRVPFVVISPYAKKKYVSHKVYDHTSVTRFVEARHRLPALSARDANALAPWDMFDFTAQANTAPPSVPQVTVDPGIVSACAQVFQGIPSAYSN